MRVVTRLRVSIAGCSATWPTVVPMTIVLVPNIAAVVANAIASTTVPVVVLLAHLPDARAT